MSAKLKRILYVEDDEAFQGLISRLLRENNYEVTIVGTMNEFSSIFNEDQYDLILMDIMLPKSEGEADIPDGGIRLTESIIEHGLPVIFLTMWNPYEFAEKIKNLMERGTVECLTKPVDRDDLLQKIEYLL